MLEAADTLLRAGPLLTHRDPEVPLFQGRPRADTLVVIVSEHPLSYAPAVAAELRLLRTCGVDIEALPISNTAIRSSRDDRLASAARRLLMIAAVAREMGQVLFRNASVACRNARDYRRGIDTLLSCMFAPGQTIGARMHWILHFARAIALGDRLRRAGVERCHVHFTTNIALFIADVFPIEVSMTLHGPRDFTRVPTTIIRRKVALSSFVRVISHDGLERVLAASASSDQRKVVLIPLGVDLQRFTGRRSHETSHRVRIVCVARLELVKGHSVLLEAFSRVARTGRPVELLLVGHGTRRKSIEKNIKRLGLERHVSFLGPLDHELLPSFLSTADVFALASFAEGLPVALMEAMASGLACVATQVNGIPELLLHEVTGLLVPRGDSGALARALTDLVDKPSLRRSLGERARTNMLSAYSAPANAARLASILSAASPLLPGVM